MTIAICHILGRKFYNALYTKRYIMTWIGNIRCTNRVVYEMLCTLKKLISDDRC